MRLLVLAAMDVEKQMLLSWMCNVKVKTLLNQSQFYEGTLNDCDFFLIETGIGKVNAAMTGMLALNQMEKSPDLLINLGVAGGLAVDLSHCDIVISDTVAYHDVDLTTFGHELGQIPGQPPVYQADIAAGQQAMNLSKKLNYPAYSGQIVTGDQFVQDLQIVEAIHQQFPKALAIDMEGAAVAHMAYRCRIPFLIIRTISDLSHFDISAKETYEKFVVQAAERSESLVRGLVYAQKNT